MGQSELNKTQIVERIYNKAAAKLDRLTKELINLDTELVNASEDTLITPGMIQIQINSVSREIDVWTEIMRLNEVNY